MPFVLICGFPSSGKSTRAQQLKEHFKAKTVNVISDHSIGVDRNSVYADSKKEKEIRGTLKSSVQRLLNTDDIVMLDSLNYIKGYRYELYCITKSCKTPHCVLLCDISKDKAKEWNSLKPEEDKYTDEILDALFMRFEEPNPNQRWDSPLFVIQADDTLPFQQIEDALFNRKPPPPNMATQNQPLSSTNFLYELDRITQETNSVIMESQKTGVPGDFISIPGTQEKIQMTRVYTLAELQRHKRQFITYTKMHPVEDTSKITSMFVQYLNNCLR
ncbi:protein KTI12 homolog [Mytilus edulis]|uniref:protein KTI12 homolog n=1 Tax=Mytilus edulis TaxID=6550 RepID=UPI0039EF4AE2